MFCFYIWWRHSTQESIAAKFFKIFLKSTSSNNTHCSPLLRFFQRSKFLAVPLFLSEHTHFLRKTLMGVLNMISSSNWDYANQIHRHFIKMDGWSHFNLKRKIYIYIFFGRTPQLISLTLTSQMLTCEQSFTSYVHFVNWRPFGLRVGPPDIAIPAMLSPSAPKLGTGTHDHRPIPKS